MCFLLKNVVYSKYTEKCFLKLEIKGIFVVNTLNQEGIKLMLKTFLYF